MNVKLAKEEKTSTKAVILYVVAIVSCIIALVILVTSQYYGSEQLGVNISGNTTNNSSSELQKETLKADFNKLLQNKLKVYNSSVEIKKVKIDKDIVYTEYEKKEIIENGYNIDLKIPYINIDNANILKFNENMKNTYIKKAENIILNKNKNVIYNFNYQVTIQNDILSVVIYSNLKEETSAQRLIVETYNFDLKNNKEITLKEIIERKGTSISKVEQEIKRDIEVQQKKVDMLKGLGYPVYERNLDNSMYKIENSKTFFIDNENIYIIYAYGNEALTTETDIIVII